MSTLNVDKIDPQSGTALEIGTSGDTITVPTGAGLTVTDEVKTNKVSPATGTAFALGDSGDTFTVPSGATLDISASTLTPPATMPASSGINFTSLNATNLGSGTVPTARLGTGTASSSVFLAGDNTWAAAGGGSLVFLAGASAISTVSDVTIDDVFTSDYKNYMAVFKILPQTSGTDLTMILRDSGGDRNEAKYNWNMNQSYSDTGSQGTQMTNYGVQQTSMTLCKAVANDADWGSFSVLWMFDPLRTIGNNPHWMWINNSQTSVGVTGGLGVCRHSEATSTNTGFKLYMSSDDIIRYYYYVYGLKES